ncbi:MAG TPA: hypothetical protein VFI42_10805, partial [Thermomicrobiaceae bacterium]|nr:hypothetical protein [Thermomicrobiaceae bacterium]
MTETYDVTVAGVGYMVKPGSYRRQQAWASEGKVGRIRLADFYGGARRLLQNERDRFWSGTGAMPAYDSQGVTAGPKRQDKTEAAVPAFQPGQPSWSFGYNGTTYLVNGTGLYQVTTSGSNYGSLTTKQTLPANAVDATQLGTKLHIAFGSAANVGEYDMASNIWTANQTYGSAARKARLIGHESQSLVMVFDTDSYQLSVVQPLGASLGVAAADSWVRRLVEHDGHCWAIADTS